ncbi:MAG: dihydroorotate dehydrogenase [Desulfurococcaceae archaeon TW002]
MGRDWFSCPGNEALQKHTYSVTPAKVYFNNVLSSRFRMIKVRPLHSLVTPEPPQFFMVWIPGVDEIPLSVADYDEEGISFIYEVKGVGTNALSKLGSGSYLGLKGPLGKPLKIVEGSSTLLVVGGSGVAPTPYITKYLAYRGCRFEVVWGVKKRSELFNLGSIMSGVEYIHIATEDCSIGYCGMASELARELVSKYKYDLVIGVGPRGMLKSLCEVTSGLNTYVVLETIVKCGLGLCGSCILPNTDKLLCVDGPAFKCEEVMQYLRS